MTPFLGASSLLIPFSSLEDEVDPIAIDVTETPGAETDRTPGIRLMGAANPVGLPCSEIVAVRGVAALVAACRSLPPK